MLIAPALPNERERLLALERLDVMDSAPEREFDALVATAALVCGVPVSLISLVDGNRQWFKANIGLPGVSETPREQAFCAHAIHGEVVFEVPDALADPRFADNPLVSSAPDIRFYAGAPLRLSSGEHVGTLCVIDRIPRQLSGHQREVLRLLSIAAVQALESRKLARSFLVSESRFRSLSESSPLGVYATDAGGGCIYTNARWQAIYGLTGAEALGQGWSHSLHPEDRAMVFQRWQESAAQKLEFDLQFRVQRADGSVRHVRSVSRPVFGADGAVTSHVGSVEDITDSLMARRSLDAEVARLAAIIQATGAGTWEWNVQTGELRLNERWAEIIGDRLEALHPVTTRAWTDRVHPEDLVRSNALLQAHFSDQTAAYECEARMRHRDGHWVWVLACGKVLTRTPDGLPEWMFGTHLDITARKAQQEQLRISEEMLNRTGELAKVGGWRVDIASGVVQWSEQTCRIHDVEPGFQPRVDQAIQFYLPEARPVIEAAVAQAAIDGRPWDLQLPMIQRNGQRIWVRTVGQAEFEAGRPVRLFGALQDVTQSVMAQQALDEAQQRAALATQSGGVGVWERDLRSDERRWDSRTYQLFGLPADCREDPAVVWARHVHPADLLRLEAAVEETIGQGTKLEIDFRAVWPDGSVHHLHSAGRMVTDDQGRPAKLIGVNWDITPLRELNARLDEQRELLQVTLQSIGDAVITTDAQSAITWLNPAAERLTGWTSHEALGKPAVQVFRIQIDSGRQPAHDLVALCLEKGATVGLAGNTVLLSRSGIEFGIEETAAPIRNPSGEILGVVLVFRDVTEQRRLSGEMSYRATHDPLTGLVNRTELENRLRHSLDKAHLDGSEHSLLFIDLDQFKLVNDTCGHSVGDQVLQLVAKQLKQTVRARDTLARLGGDEFAVLLEHCQAEQALRVAQKICDSMEEFRFVHDGRRFRIGTSIGLVPVDRRWANAAAAMQAADQSCYAAKEAGRNRVHAWFDTDDALRARQGEMQWASRLEQALDEDRFVLYAQKIEPLGPDSGGLHAEVLLRMLDVDGSLIPPAAFLPAAERFHMATRIDRWVLRHAVQRIQAMPDLKVLDMLCINLSGQSVGDRTFHRHAIDILTEAGAAVCRCVCLEITETSAVTNMADAAVFIDKVRALGVRVALDDFGAGASSFGYLKHLQVDLLKIDGSFIRDLVDDPLDDAAVRCFVDVARVLGIQTVAEFVDRPETLARIREIGVDYAQGYLLHRPEPTDRVLGARVELAKA